MASVSDVADDLLQYGEDEAAKWVETCTDDEFVRICNVAEFLIYNGTSTPSGSSMMIAKAMAIAAVYVHEGEPRKLLRGRRDTHRPLPDRTVVPIRRTNYALQSASEPYTGVGDNLVNFWAASPTDAFKHLALMRSNFALKLH